MILTKLQTALWAEYFSLPNTYVEALPWILQNAAVFEKSEVRPFEWGSNLKKKFKHTREPQ